MPGNIKHAVEELGEEILKELPGLPNYRWVALRLLEGDKRMIEAFENGELSAYVE